jgi:hypothetical protein
MLSSRILFAIFFTCASPMAKSNGSSFHDFHFSRLALEWNAETQTWQGILRVFTDDLEKSLSVAEGADRNWRLGDRRESADADSAIENYVRAHWTANQEAASDFAFHWTFVGKEIDFDLTFIYLESPAFRAPLPLSVGSDGFFELFDDQVNEITFELNGSSRREWLSAESSSVRIESIAP